MNDMETLVEEFSVELHKTDKLLKEAAVIRREMNDELCLVAKWKSIGKLTLGIAHEINTPMQYIGNNVDFLWEVIGAQQNILK